MSDFTEYCKLPIAWDKKYKDWFTIPTNNPDNGDSICRLGGVDLNHRPMDFKDYYTLLNKSI